MEKIEIKIKKLNAAAKLPLYSHPGNFGDLGADLFSVDDIDLAPGQIAAVGTGIAIQIPSGFGAVIEDRSGMAVKGLTTLAGVIDTGYRGEIRVVLANIGSNAQRISRGDRVGQLRIVKRIEGNFLEVNDLEPSSRNDKGFGSTGA